MEFKLPFPTLQDLAVLEIAHSLLNSRMIKRTLAERFQESLKKVDKLEILNEQKCRVREVLKGTQDHLQNAYTSHTLTLDKYTTKPELECDVHGCFDEVRMARDFLHKCHSDDRIDTDLLALKYLLRVATYYVLLPDIHTILQKLLKFLTEGPVIPLLEGPEFEVDFDEKLCLTYTFVDEQGITMLLNGDHFHFYRVFPAVCMSNSFVFLTLNRVFYNSELFQLHWNLIEPSKRIPFFRKTIITLSKQTFVHQLVDILHFLDLDSRRCILEGIQSDCDTFRILNCLLVWPYQVLFLPAFQLVRSLRELQHYELIFLFEILVRKQDMMIFKEILPPFWDAIRSEVKPRHSFLRRRFKDALKELSQKNVPMYTRIAVDMNLPLSHLQESRKRKHP